MSCPTCSHMMQCVDFQELKERNIRRFWCPRCGTLKTDTMRNNHVAFEEHEEPKLVGRTRELLSHVSDGSVARRIGVLEAIYTQKERQQ